MRSRVTFDHNQKRLCWKQDLTVLIQKDDHGPVLVLSGPKKMAISLSGLKKVFPAAKDGSFSFRSSHADAIIKLEPLDEIGSLHRMLYRIAKGEPVEVPDYQQQYGPSLFKKMGHPSAIVQRQSTSVKMIKPVIMNTKSNSLEKASPATSSALNVNNSSATLDKNSFSALNVNNSSALNQVHSSTTLADKYVNDNSKRPRDEDQKIQDFYRAQKDTIGQTHPKYGGARPATVDSHLAYGRPEPLKSLDQAQNRMFLNGHQGLENIGQTCYMAASLQMLYYSIFKDELLNHYTPSTDHRPVYQVLCDFMHRKSKGRVPLVRPLKQALGEVEARFRSFEQQDAHEFLLALFHHVSVDHISKPFLDLGSTLSDPLNPSTGPDLVNYRDAGRHSTMDDKTHVEPKPSHKPTKTNVQKTSALDCLKFNIVNQVTCLDCAHLTEQVQSYADLCLNLPPNTCDKEFSLDDLLYNYLAKEQVAYACSHCGGQRASLRHQFKSHPRLLLVQLNRFHSSYGKRSDDVWIPTNLTLPGSKANYKLEGIISHLGKSQTHGHYIFDRYDGQHWITFNDMMVTTSEHKINLARRKTAYILSYSRSV